MSWYKISLTSEQIIMGESQNILDQLTSLLMHTDIPVGFAVFAGKQLKKVTPYYFAPDCMPYASEIISSYDGFPCEKPSSDDIEALVVAADQPSAWSLVEG